MSDSEKLHAMAKRVVWCDLDEEDCHPLRQRWVPVGCWETHWTALGVVPVPAHPFEGLGVNL